MPLPADRVDPHRLGLPAGLLFEAYLPLLPASLPSCDCGSGADGHGRDWDRPPGTGSGSVGEVKADAIRRSAASAIRAAVRGRGDVPGGWQRWADAVLEPVVDWRRALTGGGTDLRVGIDAAMAGPTAPNFIVVLTDGLTPWPQRAPGRSRVIAGLIGDAPAPPPWITTVRIPEG